MDKARTLNPERIIDQTFQDLALCLGGIFLVHQVEDKVVWAVMKSMDELYVSARNLAGQISGQAQTRNSQSPKPHPAVEDFLAKLRRA